MRIEGKDTLTGAPGWEAHLLLRLLCPLEGRQYAIEDLSSGYLHKDSPDSYLVSEQSLYCPFVPSLFIYIRDLYLFSELAAAPLISRYIAIGWPSHTVYLCQNGT